LERWPSG